MSSTEQELLVMIQSKYLLPKLHTIYQHLESHKVNDLTLSSFSIRLGERLLVSMAFKLEFDDDTLLIPIGWGEFGINVGLSYFVI
jgi:hypothetical protein